MQRGYLETLFGDGHGVIDLRFIAPDGGVQRIPVADIDTALTEIKKHSDGENVYVGIATRKTNGTAEGDGDKEHLEKVTALWADLDHRQNGDEEAFETALKSLPNPPSMRVTSGHGEHCYWRLDEPFELATEAARDRFELVLKGLSSYLNADPTATDSTRILRVPGTTNYPGAKKRAKGLEEERCRLALPDTGVRYSLEDFEAFEDLGRNIAKAKHEPIGYEGRPWDGKLPEEVAELIQQDDLIRMRWDGSSSGLKDTSESGVDWAFVTCLAVHGVEGPALEAALRARREKGGASQKHSGYFERTVKSALGWAAEKRVNNDLNTKLEALAKLSPVEYEQCREQEAKALKFRVGFLDAEIVKRRPKDPENTAGQGTTMDFPVLEPWPEPVDADSWLTCVCAELRRYIALPKHADTAIALWCLHTHALEASTISPRLALTSPEKRCAKTLTLDVMSHLVYRAMPSANITSAAIFRGIEKWSPTLLIDEADTFLRDSDEMRGVLNSGHYRATAYIIRTVGDDHEPRKFSTWGSVVIALIGELPGTLGDRSITIPMRRRLPKETVERFRLDDGAGLVDFARGAARWAADHLDDLRSADPELPESLHDRARDNWRPLVAIADLAGGDWPKLARAAAVALTPTEDTSDGVQLLEDLRAIFTEQGDPEHILSGDLVTALLALESRPWLECQRGDKPLTALGLARRLKDFGILAARWQIAKVGFRGYTRGDLKEAFERYLPDPPQEPSRRLDGAKQRRALTRIPLDGRDLPAVDWETANYAESKGAVETSTGKPGTGGEGMEEGIF